MKGFTTTSLRSSISYSWKINQSLHSLASQSNTFNNPKQKLYCSVLPRYLCSTTNKLDADKAAPIILYEGAYSTKLRYLRIISFGSSLFCTVGLPLGLCFTNIGGSVPFVGQLLIASTAMLISLSSTGFLQVVTHPYTVVLREIPQVVGESGVVDLDKRVFRATRINFYGKFVETEFMMKDASRITTSSQPFASVKIKGSYFYIFGRHMDDIALRHALTNEE